MVAGPLYSTVAGKLPLVFSKIEESGVPKVPVDEKWLGSIGLTGSNDKTLLTVLTRLGFIDEKKNPTQVWIDFRDVNKKSQVMSDAIKRGYSDLYDFYPDAEKKTDTDLINYFKNQPSADGTTSGLSERTAQTMLLTFKTLGVIAGQRPASDLKTKTQRASPTKRVVPVKNENGSDEKDDKEGSLVTSFNDNNKGANIVLNVNIQLAVPETTDADVYDKFFAAMKKHLLS